MNGIFERPWVIGLGLCTPLGLDAATALVEAAAGSTNFVEVEVRARNGAPLFAACLTALNGFGRNERIRALARRAAWEALEQARRSGLMTRDVPVYIGLPEAGDIDVDTGRLRDALDGIAGDMRLRFPDGWACTQGRAGFFHALERALAVLDHDVADAVLVGGADSLCDALTLQGLVAKGRIQGSSPDGFIPGEGAGFVVLVRADRSARHVPGAFSVLATHLAQHRGEAGATVGTSLASVFRALRRSPLLASTRCHHLVSCQTGESRWATEFAVAYLRNGELFPEPMAYDFVAEYFGACGAASGALAMGLAQHHLARLGVSEPARVLAYGSSDEGFVGACVLGSAPTPLDMAGIRIAQIVASGRRLTEVVDEPACDLAHYEGHLEAVDALLDERRFHLETGSRAWSELESFQVRAARHLDALLLGGRSVHTLALAAVGEGGIDLGLGVGSLCALCGPGADDSDLEVVRRVIIEHLGDQDTALRFDTASWRQRLLRDALALAEQPRLDRLLDGMAHDRRLPESARRHALELASWRRSAAPASLEYLIVDVHEPPALRSSACLALAVADGRAALPAVLAYADSDRTSPVLLEALLRLQVPRALEVVRWVVQHGQPAAAHVRLLGLAGDPGDTKALLELLCGSNYDKELAAAACDALGCPGLVDTIEPLIEAWERAGARLAMVALALDRITGASLRRVGPNDEDEDESEDDEIQLPALTLACLDPAAWARWWAEQRHRFVLGHCYRDGHRMGADVRLAELEREGDLPRSVRTLAGIEMAIRSGVAGEFESDAPPARQRRALLHWRRMLDVRSGG